MMTASGRSALTFSAATSASCASVTTWSDFPFCLNPTVNCIYDPPGLAPEQPVEHRTNGVFCVLPNLVTRLALDENLLARSRVLRISRGDGEDSGSEHENEHPFVAVHEHTVGRLAQRTDDFPISRFRKRFQRARPDVSQHAQLQAETCSHGIVRSFVDRDDVIVAHGEEKGFELAAHILESFLCRVQTTWRVLHFQRALVGPICKHDVSCHSRPPSGTRQR